MLEVIKYFWKIVLVFIFVDITILFFTIFSIGFGDSGVQHIPFWDAQIAFIINLLS